MNTIATFTPLWKRPLAFVAGWYRVRLMRFRVWRACRGELPF
jgi:hypothetical protein